MEAKATRPVEITPQDSDLIVSLSLIRVLCIADGDKYKLDERGLRIEKLDLRDNGTYECRAEVSSHGNLKVRTITVDVQCEYSLLSVVSVVLTSQSVLRIIACVVKEQHLQTI